jgi:hypothetical protein
MIAKQLSMLGLALTDSKKQIAQLETEAQGTLASSQRRLTGKLMPKSPRHSIVLKAF